MKLLACCLCGIAAQGLACAQETSGRVFGPALGYVATGSDVRPLLGIPGAAYFGEALKLNGARVLALASPLDYAIVSNDAGISILHLSTGDIRLIDGIHATDAVRLSPRGTAAAFLNGRSIQVLAGMPDRPEWKRETEMPSSEALVAISDDGNTTAIADGSILSLVDSSGERRFGVPSAVRDIRFRPKTSEVLYTVGDSVAVSSVENTTALLGPAESSGDLRLAVFAADGKSVIAVDASEAMLVDPRGGAPMARAPLPCTPSELEPMSAAVVRLRCEAGSSTRLIEISEAGVRVLFVPEPVE